MTTSFECFEHLTSSWNARSLSKDERFRLLFYSWYLMAEPPYLTGFCESKQAEVDPKITFQEIFESTPESVKEEPEFLFIVGTMAKLFPSLLGDEKVWAQRAKEYLLKCRAEYPEWMNSKSFETNDQYDEYFSHTLKAEIQ